jgi:hypothetical protein
MIYDGNCQNGRLVAKDERGGEHRAISSTISPRMFSTDKYLMLASSQDSCPNGSDLP